MTGKITDFTQKSTERRTQIVGANELPQDHTPTVLDRRTRQEQVQPEVVVHEEIIREGQGRIRYRKDGKLDLRFRAAKDQAAWEAVKRGEV